MTKEVDMSLMRFRIDSVSGNDRTNRFSQHVIIIVLGYPAKFIIEGRLM